ncbi:uncharacterized protein VTP21DRAFT_8334 [Calcarisporiella thermophila]|uniref:uncharacterized protein n=1 Tax=Calcarisporiella thermophila TaxID=911321 RepID=UPI003742FD1B
MDLFGLNKKKRRPHDSTSSVPYEQTIPHPPPEFGGTVNQYRSRSPSTMSHHSGTRDIDVGSVSDALSIRSSLSSATHTTAPSDIGSASNSMILDRPSDREIEEIFEGLLLRRGVDQQQRKNMTSFPVDKKWLMICQDKQMETKTFSEGSHDKTPEYFIRKFMETDLRGVTPRLTERLAVSLRTMQLSWVRKFIESGGMHVISNALGILNRRQTKRDDTFQMETDLIKCFKSLLNNRWGAREALANPQCIYNIALSLVSPQMATRKLVCEVLIFLCYCEVPKGHNLVVNGMESLREFRREPGRYDGWLKTFEKTIDGRGLMGSMVGMSEEMRRVGPAPDNQLMEYTLSNVMLINALIGVVDNVENRVHLRSQLNASGLERIIKKLRDFRHELINLHLDKFENQAEADYEEIQELYNHKIFANMTDPTEVFQCLLASVEGKRAYDFFLSTLQHMMLIQEGDLKTRYFQLIDTIVSQIVLDRRIDNDFTNSYGISVVQLINKFTDNEALEAAREDLREAREMAEKAIYQKNQLEAELNRKDGGLVSQLKAKTNSLEDLLRMSRHTISTLQQQISDLQEQYNRSLQSMDAQLKQFYDAFRHTCQTDLLLDSSEDKLLTIRKSDLMRAFERMKAREQLEGLSRRGEVVNGISMPEPHPTGTTSTMSNDPLGLGSFVKSGSRREALSSAVSNPSRIQPPPVPPVPSTSLPAALSTGQPTFKPPNASPKFPSGMLQQIQQFKFNNTHEEKEEVASENSEVEPVTTNGNIGQRTYEEKEEVMAEEEETSHSKENDIVDDILASDAETADEEPVETIIAAVASEPVTMEESVKLDTSEPLTSSEEKGIDASSEANADNLLLQVIEANMKEDTSQPEGSSKGSATNDKKGTVGSNEANESKSDSNEEALPAIPPPPPLPTDSPAIPPPPPLPESTAPAIPPPPPLPTLASTIPPPPPMPEVSPAIPPPPPMPGTSANIPPPPPMPGTGSAIPPPPPLPGTSAIPPPPPMPGTGAGIPPPPPMPGAGIPLPPPLPGLANTSGANAVPPPPAMNIPIPAPHPPLNMSRKLMQFQPRNKLKPLFWDKMNKPNADSTFWANFNGSETEMRCERMFAELGVFDSIEQSFAVKVIEKKDAGKAKKKEEISVLDSKLAHNIHIVLGKMKGLSLKEFRRKFMMFDESLCTENLLGQLKSLTPSKDDMKKLEPYRKASPEEINLLARADLFVLEMTSIYRYQQRLGFMEFYVVFDEHIKTLSEDMYSVLDAALSIRHGKLFRELLGLVLILGNYMNGNSHVGGAFGYKIGSINKLIDTKSTQNPNMSLLHFLVEMLEKNHPHLLGFVEELQCAKAACKVSYNETIKEFRSIKSQLKRLRVELDEHYAKDTELEDGDLFPLKMREFLLGAEAKFEALEVRHNSMEVAFIDVVKYFGEDPKISTDEFFGIFARFLHSFERVKTDIESQREKERRAEKRRQHEQERRERQKAKREKLKGVNISEEPPSGSEEDKDIMDNLLESLRRGGELETNRRRERDAMRQQRMQRRESVSMRAEDLLRNIQKDEEPPMPSARQSRHSSRNSESLRRHLHPRHSK